MDLEKSIIRIIITGTTNVGKSTIANSLAGANISEVSPSPETTKVPMFRYCKFNSKNYGGYNTYVGYNIYLGMDLMREMLANYKESLHRKRKYFEK